MFTPSLQCIEMVPFWSFKTRTAWLISTISLAFSSHIRTIFYHMDTLATTISTISPYKTFTHMFLTTVTTSWSLFWWINIYPNLRFRIITSIIAIRVETRRNLILKPLLKIRLVLNITPTLRRTTLKLLCPLSFPIPFV